MGRGIYDRNETKKRYIEKYNNKRINPNVKKSKFYINTKYEYKDKFIVDYTGSEKRIIPIKMRTYPISDYFICTIDVLKLCNNISKLAFSVFIYIIENLNPETVHIKLVNKDIAKALNVKYENTISNAKKELLDNKLIEKDLNGGFNDYLINVNLAFKGNRNNYIADYAEIFGDEELGLNIAEYL